MFHWVKLAQRRFFETCGSNKVTEFDISGRNEYAEGVWNANSFSSLELEGRIIRETVIGLNTKRTVEKEIVLVLHSFFCTRFHVTQTVMILGSVAINLIEATRHGLTRSDSFWSFGMKNAPKGIMRISS
jgi:hypothetical protein